MSITIRYYQDSDEPRWDSYVLNHPQGTFFHLVGWKKVIEKTFHHKPFYLIAEDSVDGLGTNPSLQGQRSSSVTQGAIVGLLPLFSVKSILFCKSLVSLPFAAYGGILADNPQITDQLLIRSKEITRSEGLEYLELRNKEDQIPGLPSKDLYYKFRKQIFKDLKENMEAIPRKSRRMVRVGEKEGLTFQFGGKELVNTFYDIFSLSFHRLGTPIFPKKLIIHLLEQFSRSNILVIRTSEGKPIAGVLTFYYKEEVIPYYAGSLIEYRNLAPNDYMYWQLLKYGCENGYKLFDFGRSKTNTGSFDFKRHWGFEPEPMNYQYYLNKIDEIPNISPANTKYQKKIELWRKMPIWATRLIGPHIVKYIP